MRLTEAKSAALVVSEECAPSLLTEAGARKLIGELRDCLALSDDLLVRAYTGRAWEALGYESWEALCAAEIPEFRMLKLKTAARRQRVAALKAEGANIPEMVAATNSSLGSVHRDLVALEGGHTRATKGDAAFQMETGQPEADPYQGMSRVLEVVARTAAQEDRGLTCRELEHETGWHHGQASGALSRAKRQGLVAVDGRQRMGYGAHVVTDLGREMLGTMTEETAR